MDGDDQWGEFTPSLKLSWFPSENILMYAGYSTGFKSGGFEFRERQIEVHYFGELEAVDTFFVGAMKGIARVYLQTVMDCYSRHAWARLTTTP